MCRHWTTQRCEGIYARETDALTVWGKWYCQKQKKGVHFDDVLVQDVCLSIGTIEDTLLPKILKLALCMLTFEPMKALIHQFGGLGSHFSYCEAFGSDVVGGDGSGSWLDVAKLL
jgi:hypothetical protein